MLNFQELRRIMGLNHIFTMEKSTPNSSKYKTFLLNPTFYDKSHECASTFSADAYLGRMYMVQSLLHIPSSFSRRLNFFLLKL